MMMIDREESTVENAKVLITVKTYPTPSERHIETVCVAGVRIDTWQPEWVRLYPVPFRVVGFGDYKFKKYQIIDVPITRRGGRDVRPESFTPDSTKMILGKTLGTDRNWTDRKHLIGPLIGATTTCELVHINQATPMNQPAPSLGLIRPAAVVDVIAEKGQPWTPNQQRKVDRATEPTLFTSEADIINKLEPAPVQLKVRYTCMDDGCRGHHQTILDWEVGAAAFKWRERYPDDEIPEMIRQKWLDMMGPDKDTHFYIGNRHQHRNSFSILGVWYPKR